MSPQEISIKHSALGWVKKSIDDNLAEIKTDLKLYIETEDEALLEGVKQGLGVIQGVLVMIEQYGAAMLTEEMVALADFIIGNKQEQGEHALEVMLRAVLQLPDYLEHIQSGHRDIPIAILPLLNDIRAVRNQDLFSEKLLFLPDLSMHQEDADVQSIDNDSNQASKLLVKKLRPIYQLALVNIIREQSVEESLKRLEKICETLEERSVSEQIARIWWIVGALIESVSRQQLELGASIKSLLGKVDALFRVILIIGEGGLLQRQPIELIKNFLFYIAQPECDGPKAQAIKIAYRLEQFLPSESARSEVLDNIAGPNQTLLKTVAEAMKTDIESVKSALEVYVNGDLSRVDELKDLPQEMHIISDTLAMIGLGSQRQLIEAQIDIVKEILAGDQAADEEQLLSMAAELLQVEHALDQMQKRQPASAVHSRSETDVSRDYELDSVLTAVVTAALDNIQKAKNAILEFIKDSSGGENIELCIALMEESRGALQLLNQHRAAVVVEGLLTYLKACDIVDFMDADRLDALSQVVVSLEYYLESLGEHRGDADRILDSADTQLQELLSTVKTDNEGGEGQVLDIVGDQAESDVRDAEPVAVDSNQAPAVVQFRTEADAQTRPAPPVEQEQVAEAGHSEAEAEPVDAAESTIDEQSADHQFEPALASAEAITTEVETISVSVEKPLEVVSIDEELEILKPGSDPEILEIYLEEAEEESLNIARLQQDWLLHPEDENAVRNIRRAFHTIKGSGRLVGAMKIGEFAWDFEQLLNRVIDKTIPPDKRAIEAVGEAAMALRELVVELKTSVSPDTDINRLRGLARALAEFKAKRLLYEHTQRSPAVESSYDRITDGDETEWRGIGVGATTQIIPPDKLTAAILEEIEPDTVQVDSTAFEINQTEGAAAESGFGDTLLEQPPQIPGSESYTQAIDYAQARTEASSTDAVEPEEIEPDEIEPDEIEPGTGGSIKIETIGEDFLGDDYDDDLGDEVGFEAGLPESMAAEVSAAMEPEIEAPPVTDEPEAEAPPATDETDIEALSVTDEEEVEEIVLQAPTVADQEAVVETLEPEIEAEEIVLQTPALEDEEIVTQAAELEAEEIEFEALDPEFDALKVEADPQAVEAGIDVVESVATDLVEKQEEVEDQEDSPDPLVETTGVRMPGDEAGGSEPRDQEPLEATGLSFDPELLIIYQQEVEQHLDILSSALDHAERIQELVPSEEVYRALHTIHGASRTADISTIGELAGLMEKPLRLAISQKMALDHEIVALYREAQRALHAMTDELVSTRQIPRIFEDLRISFIALAEDFEEYTVEIPND
jgi:chemosensory pili system protein ChpA (sensor histidine kinase/response regulator)